MGKCARCQEETTLGYYWVPTDVRAVGERAERSLVLLERVAFCYDCACEAMMMTERAIANGGTQQVFEEANGP